MRISLLNASFDSQGGVKGHGGNQVPLNLCCLAAYARKHNDAACQIVDAEGEKLSHQETVERTTAFSPDLVGVTVNTPVFDSVRDLIELLKARHPDVPVVVGGPHPSALPEQTLQECRADFVVRGEGEITFGELVDELARGGSAWDRIDGLTYRDGNGGVLSNPARELIQDLDELPFPARDLVNNELYYAPPTKQVAPGPSTLISTSRGCPHRCGFCSAQNVWTRKLRVRGPESVVDELQECVEKYNIRCFNFADEFFTGIKDRAVKICEMIIERNLPVSWVCSARAQKLDLETLRLMRRAGCHELSFGVESGNPDVLRSMHKGTNLEEVRRVIHLTKKAGLKTHAGYVLGYAGETEETVKDTIKFAKRLNTDIAAFFVCSPLPGSDLYRIAKEEGYLRPDAKWEDYSPLSNNDPVMELPTLPVKRLRRLHRKALRGYYLRPTYIAARLLRLRHFYEIKNLIKGLIILRRIK